MKPGTPPLVPPRRTAGWKVVLEAPANGGMGWLIALTQIHDSPRDLPALETTAHRGWALTLDGANRKGQRMLRRQLRRDRRTRAKQRRLEAI